MKCNKHSKTKTTYLIELQFDRILFGPFTEIKIRRIFAIDRKMTNCWNPKLIFPTLS